MAVPLQPVSTFGQNGVDWHNKLIFGDNLQAMKTLLKMKEGGELVKLCDVAVHARQAEAGEARAPISLAAIDHFGYIREEDHYVHQSGHTLSFVATTFLPISATLVRQTIAARESIRYLVPDDVADYIQRHGLYFSV